MSAVELNLAGFSGFDVDVVLTDATHVAQRVGCWVRINVNGIEVLISPSDLPAEIIRNYGIARERKVKFVSANVIPQAEQRTHTFKPDRKFPWFCGICGYGPDEPLQHTQEADANAKAEGLGQRADATPSNPLSEGRERS